MNQRSRFLSLGALALFWSWAVPSWAASAQVSSAPVLHLAQQSTSQLYASAQKQMQAFLKNPAPQQPLKELEKILSAYQQVQARDAGYHGRIRQDFQRLHLNLKQKVAAIMDRLNQQPKPNQALLTRARHYLNVAQRLDPNDYVVYSLLGQLSWLQYQGKQALNYYAQAQRAYHQAPPQQADPLLAYTYLRQSQISSFELNNHAAALKYAKQGEAFLAQIQGRYSGQSKRDSAQLIQKKLLGRRLEIYLHLPQAKQEAFAAYRSALQQHPQNADLRAAYGALQALHGDVAGASESYREALKLNSASELTYLNWGQLHLDEASRLLKQGRRPEAEAALRKADPLFQELLRLNPKSREALQALIEIHSQLGDLKQAQRFKALLKKL